MNREIPIKNIEKKLEDEVILGDPVSVNEVDIDKNDDVDNSVDNNDADNNTTKNTNNDGNKIDIIGNMCKPHNHLTPEQEEIFKNIPEADPRNRTLYDYIFDVLIDNKVMRYVSYFVLMAMLIVGIIFVVMFFTTGMENFLYGYLGFVLSLSSLIIGGMFGYMVWKNSNNKKLN